MTGDAIDDPQARAERVRFGRNGVYDVTVRGARAEVVAEFRGHSRRLRPPEEYR